ncbi:SgcJ/EcaC family oxidoreductase [Kitasatospora sp. A2-31]|nr:SgcJ/EcaC family oxidoreductase [Kitasatospora sp. A2-31]MCG6496389.1 SgcJ/EcaC family oxidoreductase [Kitasatospora sp. A2-31]
MNDTRLPELSSTDESAVRALYHRALDGWNLQDGAAFAGPFTEDGEVIGFDGTRHSEGVRAEHGLVDPAGPALVDGAAAVDQEVVADVPPAVALDVVLVDRPDHLWRVAARVVGGGRGVVHEDRPDLPGVDEAGVAQRLVGAPAGPGDDARPRCLVVGPPRG